MAQIESRSKKRNHLKQRFGPGDSVAVLLPLPLGKPFNYLIPENLVLQIGDFVNVPFGKRFLYGVVWGEADQVINQSRLKLILKKVENFCLPEEHCRFIDWVANYTLNPSGAVLRMAMSVPDTFRKPPEKTVFFKTKKLDVKVKLTEPQRKVLNALAEGQHRSARELYSQANCTLGVILRLATKGYIEKRKVVKRQIFEVPNPLGADIKLNSEQAPAAKSLEEGVGEGFKVTLLDGVPGAGKTEVYFQAMGEALKQKKQVLILLPEIALGVQWMDRFRGHFGCFPGQWHSDLTHASRRNTWQAVAEGKASTIVGARSALFLPFKNLGLIIVDEEHEQSFKQEDGVIYNARDMAVVRARFGNCPVILVSGTPSLETTINVRRRRYSILRLTKRHGNSRLPSISALDLRKAPPERGRWLSPVLEEALKKTFSAGEQATLFINRRGYAPLTLCQSCGYRFHCPNCIAWLVEHRSTDRLQCHHCGYQAKPPLKCPSCNSENSLASCGPGVERLAEEIEKFLPDVRYLVAASDTINGPTSAANFIQKIENHKIDLIIGTQIIAKGYHFPLMTFVGVVDADSGLSGGDLRAAERTYQLLYQVAGRAGRTKKPGTAMLQTYMPEHPVIKALLNGNKEAFMDAEAKARISNNMPPFGRLVAVIISGQSEKLVDDIALSLGRSAPQSDKVRVFGPAPAPLSFLKGRFRRRLLLRASREVLVQPIVTQWLARIPIPKTVRVQVDIDPYSFL